MEAFFLFYVEDVYLEMAIGFHQAYLKFLVCAAKTWVLATLGGKLLPGIGLPQNLRAATKRTF